MHFESTSQYRTFLENCGNLSYFLSFVYMRSGKQNYALEESLLAQSYFEELSNFPNSDLKVQLRQNWYTMASIHTAMNNPDKAKECLAMCNKLNGEGPIYGNSLLSLYYICYDKFNAYV